MAGSTTDQRRDRRRARCAPTSCRLRRGLSRRPRAFGHAGGAARPPLFSGELLSVFGLARHRPHRGLAVLLAAGNRGEAPCRSARSFWMALAGVGDGRLRAVRCAGRAQRRLALGLWLRRLDHERARHVVASRASPRGHGDVARRMRASPCRRHRRRRRRTCSSSGSGAARRSRGRRRCATPARSSPS